MLPAIVVHGGAGGIEDHRVEAARAGCGAAVRAGLEILRRGGAALDAVQAAVRVLEDDPEFNAGVGAALTRDGTVELDAAIMDGATLRIGGIAAVPDLRQPIDLARLVLDDGEDALLVGEGAWRFARAHGIAPVPTESLITPRARERLATASARREGGGTVGAVAIDAAGHVAAATSTGGITHKRAGRVGDSPLAGCGTYADDQAGAASATGHGEFILRVTMTRVAVDRMRAGATALEAAQAAVAELAARTGGTAGIITVDKLGNLGFAHNTARMSFGFATAGGEITTGVEVTPATPPV